MHRINASMIMCRLQHAPIYSNDNVLGSLQSTQSQVWYNTPCSVGSQHDVELNLARMCTELAADESREEVLMETTGPTSTNFHVTEPSMPLRQQPLPSLLQLDPSTQTKINHNPSAANQPENNNIKGNSGRSVPNSGEVPPTCRDIGSSMESSGNSGSGEEDIVIGSVNEPQAGLKKDEEAVQEPVPESVSGPVDIPGPREHCAFVEKQHPDDLGQSRQQQTIKASEQNLSKRESDRKGLAVRVSPVIMEQKNSSTKVPISSPKANPTLSQNERKRSCDSRSPAVAAVGQSNASTVSPPTAKQMMFLPPILNSLQNPPSKPHYIEICAPNVTFASPNNLFEQASMWSYPTSHLNQNPVWTQRPLGGSHYMQTTPTSVNENSSLLSSANAAAWQHPIDTNQVPTQLQNFIPRNMFTSTHPSPMAMSSPVSPYFAALPSPGALNSIPGHHHTSVNRAAIPDRARPSLQNGAVRTTRK